MQGTRCIMSAFTKGKPVQQQVERGHAFLPDDATAEGHLDPAADEKDESLAAIRCSIA